MRLVIVALDGDEDSISASDALCARYGRLRAATQLPDKDPTEAGLGGVDLRRWIVEQINVLSG